MSAARYTFGEGRAASFDRSKLPPANSSNKDKKRRQGIRRSLVAIAISRALQELERGNVAEYREWQAVADKAATWGRI